MNIEVINAQILKCIYISILYLVIIKNSNNYKLLHSYPINIAPLIIITTKLPIIKNIPLIIIHVVKMYSLIFFFSKLWEHG